MDINNHNYEEFAIDYLEGNLSPELEEAMQLFLLQNPDIEAELMGLGMEELVLEADRDVVFPDKEILLQLEEQEKVVPLYSTANQATIQPHTWKRYALAIAAALCLFFVWQGTLNQKVKDVEVAEMDGNEGKGNNVKMNGDKAEIAGIDGSEDMKIEVENDSEIKNHLKYKVNGESLTAKNTASTTKNSDTEGLKSVKEESNIAAKTDKVKLKEKKEIIEGESFAEESRSEVVAFSEDKNRGNTIEVNQNSIGKQPQKNPIIAVNTTTGFKSEATETLKENKNKNRSEVAMTLAALPQQTLSEIDTEEQDNQESIVAAEMPIDLKLRELPETESTFAAVEDMENSKSKSTFLNNLKKAITPEILAGDEMEESGTGSEILVSISMKPNQHDFIKKIFKSKK